MWPLLILAGGALAALATYMGQREQVAHEETVRDKLTKAETAQSDAITKLDEAGTKLDTALENETEAKKLLQKSMELQADANKELERANAALVEANQKQEKAQELLNLTIAADRELIGKMQETIGNVTGGDSIFYFHLTDSDGFKQAWQRVDGKFPLSNLHATVYDLTAIEKLGDVSTQERNRRGEYEFPIVRAWKDSMLIASNFPFPTAGDANYYIRIAQPNGNFVQFLALRDMGDGKYSFGYRVFKEELSSNQVVLGHARNIQHFDSNFPHVKDGKPDWINRPETWQAPNVLRRKTKGI